MCDQHTQGAARVHEGGRSAGPGSHSPHSGGHDRQRVDHGGLDEHPRAHEAETVREPMAEEPEPAAGATGGH